MHANLHIKTHSRSAGKSAVAAASYRSGSSMVAKAAYRSGDKLHGQREDVTHDYSRKQHVQGSEIIAPAGAPDWANDREQLWNKIEQTEKRKDAQLAKEAVFTLPRNLSHEQHREVVNRWVADNITPRGLVADVSYHNPKAEDGKDQPHAHLLFTMRPLKGDDFGKKQSGYKTTFGGWEGLDSKNQLHQWRKSYEHHLNAVTWEDGQLQRFQLTHDREKAYIPSMSLAAAKMESRGVDTRQGRKRFNEQLFASGQTAIRRHINSYKQIGGGSHHHAYFVEAARHDLGETWYDFAYGSEEAKDIIDSDDKGLHR